MQALKHNEKINLYIAQHQCIVYIKLFNIIYYKYYVYIINYLFISINFLYNVFFFSIQTLYINVNKCTMFVLKYIV